MKTTPPLAAQNTPTGVMAITASASYNFSLMLPVCRCGEVP